MVIIEHTRHFREAHHKIKIWRAIHIKKSTIYEDGMKACLSLPMIADIGSSHSNRVSTSLSHLMTLSKNQA